MKLRIKKFYHFGRLPYYSIQRLQDKTHWIKVLDLTDDNLVLAKKLKKFLLKNGNL